VRPSTIEHTALEAPILGEPPAAWPGIAFKSRQAFLLRLAFLRGTHETPVTGCMEHAQVFDRVALLLATVVVRLFLEVKRARARSLRTLMPKRGGRGPILRLGGREERRERGAVRVGRKSWWAHARVTTGWRSCIHVCALACDIPKSWPGTSWMGFCCREVSMKSNLSAIVGKGEGSSGL
jgi:hypothetical protein